MYPPIFEDCAANAGVQAVLGTSPTRFYPAWTDNPPTLPYATWQSVDGEPLNCLGESPDMDVYTIQVDAYAATLTSAREVASALRAAIQAKAHIVGYNGESRDPDTEHYRYSFTVDWFVDRDTLST